MIVRLRLRCLDLADKNEALAQAVYQRDRQIEQLRARVAELRAAQRSMEFGQSEAVAIEHHASDTEATTQAGMQAIREQLLGRGVDASLISVMPEAAGGVHDTELRQHAELEHVEALFRSLQKQRNP